MQAGKDNGIVSLVWYTVWYTVIQTAANAAA